MTILFFFGAHNPIWGTAASRGECNKFKPVNCLMVCLVDQHGNVPLAMPGRGYN